MAQLTYLEVTNKVLRKLRETTVTSVTYNTYSTLIGEFVNDAKKEVESAYTWSALRTAVTFSSVIGQRAYDLSSDTDEDSRLLYEAQGRPMAFDITLGTETQLYRMDEDEMERQFRLAYPAQTIDQPCHFSLSQNGDGFTLTFLESPTQVRDYLFYFCVPQGELENGADVISVPWRPIRDLAVIYALDERGEEIGEPGSKAWMRYENSLTSAIAIDALNNSHRTDFTV